MILIFQALATDNLEKNDVTNYGTKSMNGPDSSTHVSSTDGHVSVSNDLSDQGTS